MSKDTIYQSDHGNGKPFKFDDSVAAVFPDMINRSVPGYADTLDGIRGFASALVPPQGTCYDLGCSLGAATLAICMGLENRAAHIVAVDNSAAMIERCRSDDALGNQPQTIDLRCEDIADTPISDASLVVLNFTLQFVQPALRRDLLARIYAGLRPDGALILSEKFRFNEPATQLLMTRLHHDFKRRNHYSEMEIAGKRNALENVLIADTRERHIARLEEIGFRRVTLWQANLNFGSIVAFRDND